MTVHSINGDNIDCQWFDNKGTLHSATFPLYMLTIIEGAADDAARVEPSPTPPRGRTRPRRG